MCEKKRREQSKIADIISNIFSLIAIIISIVTAILTYNATHRANIVAQESNVFAQEANRIASESLAVNQVILESAKLEKELLLAESVNFEFLKTSYIMDSIYMPDEKYEKEIVEIRNKTDKRIIIDSIEIYGKGRVCGYINDRRFSSQAISLVWNIYEIIPPNREILYRLESNHFNEHYRGKYNDNDLRYYYLLESLYLKIVYYEDGYPEIKATSYYKVWTYPQIDFEGAVEISSVTWSKILAPTPKSVTPPKELPIVRWRTIENFFIEADDEQIFELLYHEY